jgi:hypothetical protein
LVRKDVASSGSVTTAPEADGKSLNDNQKLEAVTNQEDFSSKAQIMTLMTADVDRISDFAYHIFSLVGKLITCENLQLLIFTFVRLSH